MKVWIDGSVADPSLRVFGLDLIERHLLALKRLASLRALPTEVVIEMGINKAEPRIPEAARQAFRISVLRNAGSATENLLRFARAAGSEPVLIVSGDTLVDARLYSDLAQRSGSWIVQGEGENEGAAILRLEGRDIDRIPATATTLSAIAQSAAAAGIPRLSQQDFNGFIRKLRRTLPFYLQVVKTPIQVKALQRFLFWSNYKGSTDLFTKYVYPPLVWLMVRPLAAARIHPNTVTIVSILMTFLAIPFFATGHFLIGFLLSYGMSVLDSVDGKLARLTFTDSKLGNVLDHGLDLIHPPMWYVAWAVGLAQGDFSHPLVELSAVLTIVYVLDRIVLKIYPQVFKRGLHTHSKMDGFVRTFIARRNIALPIFTLGVLADWIMGTEVAAVTAFYVTVLWYVATLLYHGGRTFWIFYVEKAQLDPSRASAT